MERLLQKNSKIKCWKNLAPYNAHAALSNDKVPIYYNSYGRNGITRNSLQLLTFALEIFSKGNFREKAVFCEDFLHSNLISHWKYSQFLHQFENLH